MHVKSCALRAQMLVRISVGSPGNFARRASGVTMRMAGWTQSAVRSTARQPGMDSIDVVSHRFVVVVVEGVPSVHVTGSSLPTPRVLSNRLPSLPSMVILRWRS